MRIAVLIAALVCFVIAVTKYQNSNQETLISNQSPSNSKPKQSTLSKK